MTIALSGSFFRGAGAGNTTIQPEITTPGASLVVVVVVVNNNTSIQVSSISASGGLPGGGGFTLKDRFSYTDHSGHFRGLEVWYANSTGALLTKTINVNFPSGPADSVALAFGVTGHDPTTIWDTNSSLPGTQSRTTGGVPTAPFSTSSPATLAFALLTDDGSIIQAAGAFGTGTPSLLDRSGAGTLFYGIETVIFSTAQTSKTATFSGGSVSNDYGVLVEAIRQAPVVESGSITTNLTKISQSAVGNVAQTFGSIATNLNGISQDADAEEIVAGTIETKLGNNLVY